MFCIHRCIKLLCCICVTWKCYVTGVCFWVQVLGEVCFVHWLPFLAQEKVSFLLSLTRCNYPRISKEHCGIIGGEWRFNSTKKRKWAKCCTAGACAAEEASESSNSVWTGQLWLRGEVPRGPGSQSGLRVQDANTRWPPPIFQAVKLGLKLIGLARNKTEDYSLSLSKDQHNDHSI